MSYPSCEHGNDDPNNQCPICELQEHIRVLQSDLSTTAKSLRFANLTARAERDEAAHLQAALRAARAEIANLKGGGR